ncbi:MAG: hypothetical protein PHC61_05445, partial [Chitinivibrionales bacterium]|nr:hypothetical protein [Chitinivibrionales bacterium]
RPDADPGWRPFVYGHWVYSNEGWVWDSDEPFGWIVCHYGNWYNDREPGWVWVPAYEWSPARVRWHVTDDEIGSSPLLPEPRHGHHRNAIEVEWSFCPVQFFTEGEIFSHVAIRAHPERSGVQVRVYAGPPRREFVQRVVRTPIVSISLNKVRVTTHERPLIRVEVGRREPARIVVPIGPRYKRVTVRSEPRQGNEVTVIHEQPPQVEPRVNVTVTHDEGVRTQVREQQSDNPRVRVETRSATPEVKVRVKSKDDQDNQGDDNNGNNHGKKKVRVEMDN